MLFETTLSALAAALILPISAATVVDPLAAASRSISVSTADLDLRTERGARLLDLRILHAASELCGTPSAADPRGVQNRRICKQAVIARSTPQRDRLIADARQGNGPMLAAISVRP